MGTPPISHPPTPIGATTREQQTITALHREATTTGDRVAASAMLAGVDLIVDLIRTRDKRRSFDDQWDQSQAEGSDW